MQVSEWGSVQADASPYSQYWGTPNSFEPQTFSQNTAATRTCNGSCWAVFFDLNFALTVALVIWVSVRYANATEPANSRSLLADEGLGSKRVVGTVVGGSFGLGIGVNILHFLYTTLAPFVYIKYGFIAGIVFAFAFAILPMVLGFYAFIVFPIIMVPIWLIFACTMRPCFELSAAILKITTQLICKHPSIFFLLLVQGILQLAIAAGIVITCVLAEYLNCDSIQCLLD
jgi:hypothetical protein